MTAPRLVTPDLVRAACIEVIANHHNEHLAALERDRGLTPKTIEPFKTVAPLVRTGLHFRESPPPSCLIGVFGLHAPPEEERNRELKLTWAISMQILAVGQNATDTLLRRDLYSMTASECLLQRLPRDVELIDRLSLLDIDLSSGATDEQRARTVGEVQLQFEAVTRKTLSLGGLPPANTTIPPGQPGGPPEAPYTPSTPWPTVSKATADVERQPLPQED